MIGGAIVTFTPDGACSTYADGATWGAHPHDTADYREITRRCGYGDDILAYCREHEICHHIVGEMFYGGKSPILWELAHGRERSPADAVVEECAVQMLQRWVRAGERPIIGGVDWYDARDRVLRAI